MFYARPGYSSGGTAHIEVLEVSEDYSEKRTVVAYDLKYLPDTHEVVLVKTSGDAPESVYSELLDHGPDAVLPDGTQIDIKTTSDR